MRRLAWLLPITLATLAVSALAQETVHLADIERFSGVYQLFPGQFIYIQPWPGGDRKLVYTDEMGQIKELVVTSKNEFSGGLGLRYSTPAEVKITFVRTSEGNVTHLIRQQNGLPDQIAKKMESFRREEVNFQNGDVNLAGTLSILSDGAAHPAIVLIHGTGDTDRNTVLPLVHFLINRGIALLGFDKRGVGGSTGDWRTASIEDLAGDAVAAVKYLQNRKDIDSKRIGLLGASQGGWVVPLAASKFRGIAFVISVSGPAMSPAEVDSERLIYRLHAKEFPTNAIDEALALVKLRDEVAEGRESWENFQAAVEKAKETEWFPYVYVPQSADSWLFKHWRSLPLDYDPKPVIARLHVPVLALFGALDHTVFPDKNAERWREALQNGEARDYKIKIFPTGNHMLLEATTGEESEYPVLKRFVPDFQPVLLDWLREHKIIQTKNPRLLRDSNKL